METYESSVDLMKQATQSVLVMPFDAMKEQYRFAVRAGLRDDSMTECSRYFKTLGVLEKCSLGPFARSV